MVGAISMYYKIIKDKIEEEKKRKREMYSLHDEVILKEMLKEINLQFGTSLKYLSEVEMFTVPRAGKIVSQYFNRFQSETIRAYLLPWIVSDKIENCATIVYDAYNHFKESDEYISAPGKPSPAHIHVRYDNAFIRLKPKRMREKLILLANNPRDAFYLPFTVRMLASWKTPSLEKKLIEYMNSAGITAESVGITDSEDWYPSIYYIRRELLFTGIQGLQYYSSKEAKEEIEKYCNVPDVDIRTAAQKAMKRVLECGKKSESL